MVNKGLKDKLENAVASVLLVLMAIPVILVLMALLGGLVAMAKTALMA
tara:strand:+ start:219 stop:362 length:144 start_codon:yes stop_codon:yes gene_type:complete